MRGRLGANAVVVSLDDLFPLLHPAAPSTWQVFSTLGNAALATARRGFDVIVDTVFERPESLDATRRALVDHRAFLVAVTCSLEVLEERARARGDRRIGQARGQFQRVLQGAAYDLHLDTSQLSVDACTERIVALVNDSA